MDTLTERATMKERMLDSFIQSPAGQELKAEAAAQKSETDRIHRARLQALKNEREKSLLPLMAKRDAVMLARDAEQKVCHDRIQALNLQVHELVCEVDFMKDRISREENELIRTLGRSI